MNKIEPIEKPLPPDLIPRFAAIVGDRYALTDQTDIAPYTTEERELYHGHTSLVLRPGSTAEVSAICKLATETRTPLVPQGGNTGLVGGQTPHHGEVVVSMRRMDRIREIDPQSNTMIAEAGVVVECGDGAESDRACGHVSQWTILDSGSSMMSVAPASDSAGIRTLISFLGTTVSTA